MSNKAILTFEYLVVNSLLIVNALDQHPEYSQKIIEYYHEDYVLINLVKFYKKQ
jgi:hypothetical protein